MLSSNLEIKDKKAVIKLSGTADTISSEAVYTDFEKALNEGCNEFEFNMSDVEYVCSATLRAFIRAQKICNSKECDMYLTGASEGVKDVFEITGFAAIIRFA